MLIEVVDCTSVNASDSPNIFCIAPINGDDGTPITFEMSCTAKTKTIVLKGAVIGTRSFIFVIFAKWSMALIFQVGRKKFTSLPDCNITMNLNCSEVVPSHFLSLMAIFYFESPVLSWQIHKWKLYPTGWIDFSFENLKIWSKLPMISP